MKQKIFALCLILLFLPVHSSFVFSQTGSAARSTDELVAMLDEPEVAAVVNLKKVLSETAPSLFNGDAASLKLLATAMKTIEDESGVNPYSLDKIVLGAKVSKINEDLVIIMQSDSSAKLAESIYQHQLSNAGLANRTNPLHERIFVVRNNSYEATAIASSDAAMRTAGEKITAKSEVLKTLAAELDKLPPSKTNQTLIDELKAETAKAIETLGKIEDKFKTSGEIDEFSNRADKLDKQILDIALSDPQREAKLSEIEKNITRLEKDFGNYKREDTELRKIVSGAGWMQQPSSLEETEIAIKGLPIAEPRYAARLRAAQTSLAAALTALNKTLTDIQPENLSRSAANAAGKQEDEAANAPVPPAFPKSTVVTRKEETVEGRKIVVVTTVKSYGDSRTDETVENLMLAIDDKNLMVGERDSVVKSLNDKNAGRNQALRSMIAKSPDALVAFGVDLQSVDYSEISKFLGEQKNAWQAYGSLTSAGNDLTLEAILEKTDRPLNLPAKTDNSGAAAAADHKAMPAGETAPAASPELDNLIFLLTRSIVGVEGRFTVRFEKKKVAAMINESPKILRELLAGRVNSAKTRKK